MDVIFHKFHKMLLDDNLKTYFFSKLLMSENTCFLKISENIVWQSILTNDGHLSWMKFHGSCSKQCNLYGITPGLTFIPALAFKSIPLHTRTNYAQTYWHLQNELLLFYITVTFYTKNVFSTISVNKVPNNIQVLIQRAI